MLRRIWKHLLKHASPWVSKMEPRDTEPAAGIQFQYDWPDAVQPEEVRHLFDTANPPSGRAHYSIMKAMLFKLFVGKNSASLARAAATMLGGVILGSALYSADALPDGLLYPSPEDAALAEAYNDVVPGEAAVKDGLTVDETVRIGFGFLLIWVARLTSYIRAKNLDWLANIIGLVIGRSVPSLLRSAMTATSGLLLYLGIKGSPDLPLAGIGEAIILFVLGRVFSSIEDGKRNPV
jgi:hypothetical protein